MALWRDIAAGQYAANTLLLPSFNLRMLGNDWALAHQPFDYKKTETTGGSLPGTAIEWRVAGTLLKVNFPTNWGYDSTYAATLTLRISVRVEAYYSAGTPSDIRIAEIAPGTVKGTTDSTLGASYGYHTLTLDYVAADGDTLPTGVKTYVVEFYGGDGDQIKFRHTLDDEGPNSWFGFVTP